MLVSLEDDRETGSNRAERAERHARRATSRPLAPRACPRSPPSRTGPRARADPLQLARVCSSGAQAFAVAVNTCSCTTCTRAERLHRHCLDPTSQACLAQVAAPCCELAVTPLARIADAAASGMDVSTVRLDGGTSRELTKMTDEWSVLVSAPRILSVTGPSDPRVSRGHVAKVHETRTALAGAASRRHRCRRSRRNLQREPRRRRF